MESPPMFNSVEDECRYWKERAKLYHKEWTDVKQEYDEYVEQSRQMEAEMDATLDQKQSIIKDLRLTLSSLEKENESLKLKLQSHGIELANTERQMENFKTERDSLKVYLRQLEQKNDDLERAHRILNESIADFERMLDKAYEKNALLEMEVDEKEMLQEKLQRLMDETRDLKQELNVKTRNPLNGSVNNISESTTLSATIANGAVNNSDITHEEISLNNTSLTHNLNNSPAVIPNYGEQHSLKNSTNLLNGNAMTPSSRTSALNIVADMLRKLNLDRALLCPLCERFRCICDRSVAAAADSTSSCASTPTTDSVGRLRRSLTNTFGSNNSMDTNATVTSTNTSYTDYDADVSDVSLRRIASRSNSSLNFGTNIFKRFADRMSGGNIIHPNSTKTPISTKNKNISK
ncbi:nuclear distribution protein nudE homolog isoform X2 [Bactrocera oleae]|uniref:nuclear distribution protein nudE homolog isoform X2 n=1 Tax=Bactrocera oleae TaxID=104688 RepID=UPI00174C2322|nr:nuclear distribution protein nudE homolog isoform X2 [Bactrocera oleae]XP_036219954.1 nuclear distribution protein nudE homolog isoform X2 [Bactrocera oleae]XP_036219955.1 nuclear distribution protein nudE homolog isoform X2 [Bactrocera oleae]XP_036219956.1 nuclear distribution protein nudE homolog isoform X2 [Bactrocera oleae]